MSDLVAISLLIVFICTATVLGVAAVLAESGALGWAALCVYTWAVAQTVWHMKDNHVE